MIVRPSEFDNQRRQLEPLEKEIREKALIFRKDFSGLLKVAMATYSQPVYDSLISRLRILLDAHATECMRTSDPFRPYGPEQLLSQGDLHLMDQMDGVRFSIDPDKLVTGMLIIGPQGSGKSRFIVHLCNETRRTKPAAKITIIDPKGGFRNLPNFRHIDLSKISIDLASSSNASQDNFIYEFMPILADTCNLVYSLAFLNRAVDIVRSQHQQYLKQTGNQTNISLQDIFEALRTIKVNNFREIGYHTAAKTALGLVIGKQDLFRCRKGLSFDWLFSENAVINARSLTSELQCKSLITFALFWLYQRARNMPETNEIKQVIIIDDATRFIGVPNQFGSQKRTSPLGHVLAVLRSAGICVVFATQLPAQIDPAVLALSRNMFVIGNVNGEENLRVIQSFMSLTPERKNAIPKFQTRELLAFISNSPWPYPVRGWATFVDDLPTQSPPNADVSNMIIPWHPLTEIPQKETPQAPATINDEQPPPNAKGSVDTLIYDCVTYPFDKVRERVKRLGFSIRTYETVKNEAVQDGYLIPSQSGKSLYLIPTPKAYEKFSQPYPYKRSTSIEHSFYVLLTAHILKKDSTLSKIQAEVPIGLKGATIDVTSIDKAGMMVAYEVTLSTSNLLSNATKLQDTAYKRIIWLCKDAATANAVKAYFNKSSTLPSELTAKFDYLHFAKFSSQIKKRR